MKGYYILALAALGFVTTSSHAQQTNTYHVVTLGPAWQGVLPAMGLDLNGRVAGTVDYSAGTETQYRAWVYGIANGYRLVEAERSTANAVSPNGLIVGSQFGSPTTFDWMGNSTLVLPQVAGSFMAVNAHNDKAGYLFDVANNMIQTAFVLDRDGNMISLGDPTYVGSAAYGNNDNGAVVGYATNTDGQVRAFVWDGQTNFLNGPADSGYVAIDMNNVGTVVGYAVTPTDRLLPLVWTTGPRSFTFSVMELPTGFESGAAGAVNNSGMAVGTMWTPGQSPTAFVWTAAGGTRDLNDLRAPDSRTYRLMTAGAVNDEGWIIGLAEINGQNVAYLASPSQVPVGPRRP